MSGPGDRSEEEPRLFDLPLEAPHPEPAAAPPSAPAVAVPSNPSAEPRAEPEQVQQQIALEESRPDEPIPFESEPSPESIKPPTAAPSQPAIATLGQRLLSGGADILIHAGALAGAALGLRVLGIEPRVEHWPSLLALLLAFSFLYTVVALAFWGQTAGMAWFGLAARESQQFPLSFAQACLRWLAGWVTVLLAGLPILLVFFGSSLSDRLSGSRTYRAYPSAA